MFGVALRGRLIDSPVPASRFKHIHHPVVLEIFVELVSGQLDRPGLGRYADELGAR